MKNFVKFFGIIVLATVIGFLMVSCMILGTTVPSDTIFSANIANVPPGYVPVDLVGKYYADERMRQSNLSFEITSDGRMIYYTNGRAYRVATIYADRNTWTITVDGVTGEPIRYTLDGNILYFTMSGSPARAFKGNYILQTHRSVRSRESDNRRRTDGAGSDRRRRRDGPGSGSGTGGDRDTGGDRHRR